MPQNPSAVGMPTPKSCAASNAISTHTTAAIPATTAATSTFAASTVNRLGKAVSVARIIPCRYSWPIEKTPTRPRM